MALRGCPPGSTGTTNVTVDPWPESDLFEACDGAGVKIFVKATHDPNTNVTTYSDPATGAVLTPNVDFQPCADGDALPCATCP